MPNPESRIPNALSILVIGSGGREHALCLALAESPRCGKLFCAPGNVGIADIAKCLPVAADDIAGIVALCGERKIDFVVVGPEVPLSLGLADAIRLKNIPCFGPSQKAAQLESSKGFMKDICAKAGVPTAAYRRFTDAEAAKTYVREQGAPIVVKADGLAAGKGVTVAQTLAEALAAIDDAMVKQVFGAAGAEVVVEEFMAGEEASFFALCDGEIAIPFAAAQDHKAVFDGDKGPNTGGMGAYSPAPIVDVAMQSRIMAEIINPTMRAMKDAGTPFTGVLFAGLMIGKAGPRLIEFNVRFGDPETQAMLPRLTSDLVDALYAAATGRLASVKLEWSPRHALCVVMAAKGYPGAYQKGSVIGGLDRAAAVPDVTVLHAGTARNAAGDITANGGRVLGIVATGETLKTAQTAAYRAVDALDWKDGFCRRDIGWRAVK